jgi:hypothetical protein
MNLRSKLNFLALCLILAFTAAASARTEAPASPTVQTSAQPAPRILYYSSLVKIKTPPQECLQAGAIIAPFLKLYHSPAEWTWVVICDEVAWHDLEVRTRQNNMPGRLLGLTNRDSHVTFIRGYDVLHPSAFGLYAEAMQQPSKRRHPDYHAPVRVRPAPPSSSASIYSNGPAKYFVGMNLSLTPWVPRRV